MKNVLNLMLIMVLIITIEQAQCSEPSTATNFYSIVIPGQNGAGGYNFKQNKIVNTSTMTNYSSIGIGMCDSEERGKIDFGQDNCIEHFEAQYREDAKARAGNNILFCVSQGTATITNWLAKKSHAEQERMVRGLVLESVLGSPRSAILHTASNIPILTYLPFARFWIPLVAKAFMFPTYKLDGQSVFSSATKLSTSLPIVIMHNRYDFQLSINDARRMYCALKARQNDQHNVYLMEIAAADNRHFDVLDHQQYHQRALQAIYKQHGLPYCTATDTTNVDLTMYQPAVEDVQKRITKSERYRLWTRNTIDAMTVVAIAGGMYVKYFKGSRRVF